MKSKLRGLKSVKEEEDDGMEAVLHEGDEALEDDGSESEEEEETDAIAAELLAAFKAEVFHDPRRSSDLKETGHQIARNGKDAENAERFMEWLIAPVGAEKFYDDFWEQRPFIVSRANNRDYYKGWFSKQDIEGLLEERHLEYGRGVDVTRYEDGQRFTLNGEGIASSGEVWGRYKEGCSVRVLHPQRWSDSLWLMLSTLERHWNCIAGCNVYLTPAGAQGFSPHYDDIEAFILQVEGRKRWRCYRPRSASEVLPRLSSADFSQDEIGEPILEVDLEPGDLLFMPRGTIHQAVSAPDAHSLHITLSASQRNTWADYLEVALPRAIELAAEEHVELRGSVPRNLFNFMGVMHSDRDDPKRTAFSDTISSFLDLIFESGPWDSAADQLAVRFIKSRLPLHCRGETGSAAEERTRKKVTSKSRVRLAAPGVARLVMEEDCAVVYHMMENSRQLHNTLEEEDEEGRSSANEGDGDGPQEGSAGSRGREGNEGKVPSESSQRDEGEVAAEVGASRASASGHGNGTTDVRKAKRKGESQLEGHTPRNGKKQKGEPSGNERPRGTVTGEPSTEEEAHGLCTDRSSEEPPTMRGRIEFPAEWVEAVDQLILAYPDSLQVTAISLDSKAECLQLARTLVKAGVLVVEK